MATDWDALQAQFLLANAQSGITVKRWCADQGLNYASARRYIKLLSAEPELQQKVHSAPSVKSLPGHRTSTYGPPFGNQNAVKHHGYSKYFTDEDLAERVEACTLEDELRLCRSRIHLVVKTMGDIQADLEKRPSTEVAASLYNALGKAEVALDKNIARVESITRTLSTLALDALTQDKIIADTQRSRAAGKLIALQVDKLRQELGGSTKLDAFIDKLTAGHDHVVN